MEKTLVSKIEIREVHRDTKDISTWRNALIYAEAIYNPNRQPLYDLYSDIMLDAHLTALINKRVNAIVNQPLKFVNNEKENEAVTDMLNTEAFIQLVTHLLMAKFWGFSLVELQFDTENNAITHTLIDRRHVKPTKKLVVKYPQDMWGIDYTKPPYDKYVIFSGQDEDLGILLKAAPHVLYKRGVIADWAQFSEIFGMPFRKGTYDGYDDNARRQLEGAIKNAGSASYAIIPEGTNIEFIQSTATGSTDLYNELRKACNDELSVLILGQTLTTNQGDKGARSLGEVHAEVESMINAEDRIFIMNQLNHNLLPLMEHHGYDVKGGKFVFDETETIDTAVSVDIDLKLAQRIPISDDYFYEKYNIPKPDNYDQLIAEKQQQAEALKQPPPDPLQLEGEEESRFKAGQGAKQQTPLAKKGFFDFFVKAP